MLGQFYSCMPNCHWDGPGQHASLPIANLASTHMSQLPPRVPPAPWMLYKLLWLALLAPGHIEPSRHNPGRGRRRSVSAVSSAASVTGPAGQNVASSQLSGAIYDGFMRCVLEALQSLDVSYIPASAGLAEAAVKAAIAEGREVTGGRT